MDRPPDADDSPYLRLPWPLVAGVLAAVLLLALGLGLWANQNLRQSTVVAAPTPAPTSPPVAIAPTATTATTAPPTPVPATPTPAPAPAPLIVVISTLTPVPPTATAVPPAPATVTAAAAVTPRPTVDPTLVDEIDRAYEQYWQVRAQALFELDETRLPEVMGDEHLAAVSGFIVQLRSENRAVETDVKHSYQLAEVTPESVQVLDTYVDNSVYVDPQSGARLTEPVGNTLIELYRMHKADGKWRVLSLVRSQ